MPVSNDIYGNDVSNMHDNCFETDGGMHNQRVFRNRCFNAGVGAMSPQPIFGGPVYFIRNVVYNSVYGPLKIQADPSGILVYQNTYVGEIQQITPASNLHFRNNLIMGTKARPALLAIDTHTPWSSSDYNGFHVNEAPSTRSSGTRRRPAAPSTTRRRAKCGASRRSPSISARRGKTRTAAPSTTPCS